MGDCEHRAPASGDTDSVHDAYAHHAGDRHHGKSSDKSDEIIEPAKLPIDERRLTERGARCV